MIFQNNCPLAEAKWVGGTPGTSSPIILRRFQVHNVKKTTLYVTGLGFFEAKINGQKVSEDRYVPVVSDYEPRALETFCYPLQDILTHRVYYCKYDVTPFVRNGANLLSVQLGNGWYRQKERLGEGKIYFGEDLKTIYTLVLETTEGMKYICSDGSETWYESEILYNNLFIGEVVDPFSVGTEKPVRLLQAPEAEFTEQIGVPDRVIRHITPQFLGELNGKKVFDAGENISGVVQIHTKAPKGERIRLRFAENIDSNLKLDFYSTGSECICQSKRPQIMEDVFVADGTERTFEPKFVWHAFRYFEVEGNFEEAEVLVIHSHTPVTASFESNSEGMQFLWEAFLRTQLDNMHGSIPSDCPHRERLGYTGDGQICAPAVMMIMDCKEFYRKWIRDILDCQDRKTGHVQHTAPLMGGGGGPGGWGCAIVLVPYAYYRQFGEIEILQECYAPMKHWIDYLLAHSENDLVTREETGGWCLGDWCTLEETKIPEPFVNSCYLLKCLQLLKEIAEITENHEDIVWFEELAKKVSAVIKSTYYDKNSGHFCEGIQGADAYAVWVGLSGAGLAACLAEKYTQLGHFDTGFLATDILMEVLMDFGYGDVALQLLESREKGSFLYMKDHGATTLWEKWTGEDSHNHPMFGASVRQFFSGFLGIRQKKGCAAYEAVEISPRIPQKLDYVKGSILTPKGEIKIAWEKTKDSVKIDVKIPNGTRAVFCYKDIYREISSGEYQFIYEKEPI